MSTRKSVAPPKPDSAWAGLAQGDLSPEEQAMLRALAEESEAAAVHYEAYAPLAAVFAARTAALLDARVEKERRSRQRRYFAGAASTLLAAAAAFVMLALPREGKLGRYTLEVRAGAASVRGASVDGGQVHYNDASRLLLIARPMDKVEGPVVATLFAVVNGRAQHVPARVEIADSGAVRLEVAGQDLPATEEHKLALVVLIDRKVRSDSELLELHRKGAPELLVAHVSRVPAR